MRTDEEEESSKCYFRNSFCPFLSYLSVFVRPIFCPFWVPNGQKRTQNMIPPPPPLHS